MKIFLTMLTSALMLLYSCMAFNCEEGNGNIQRFERTFSGAEKILLAGSGKVILGQSDNEGIIIEIDDNLEKFIRTDVVDGRLIIEPEESICPSEYTVYVSMETIRGVQIQGSGDITSADPINCDEFEAEVDGSGNIGLSLAIDGELEVEINGSGDIRLKGNAKEGEIGINGSGDVMMGELLVDGDCYVEINGTGDVMINNSGVLNVEINGSGDVIYSGNPTEINQEINGSGSLKKKK